MGRLPLSARMWYNPSNGMRTQKNATDRIRRLKA